MIVSVLIPYRPDVGSARERLAEFTIARLRDYLPVKTQVVVIDDYREHGDLFNHGQAINRAAEIATGDVLLIADADTTFGQPAEILTALHATGEDRLWRLPQRYVQLSKDATLRVLAGQSLTSLNEDDDFEWVGDRISWSGLVVVPREAFERVGGADERYVGHGADDVAFGLALETLYGPHERFEGTAVHLWHPRGEQELDLHEYGVEQLDLTYRYMDAAGNQELMTELVSGKRP